MGNKTTSYEKISNVENIKYDDITFSYGMSNTIGSFLEKCTDTILGGGVESSLAPIVSDKHFNTVEDSPSGVYIGCHKNGAIYILTRCPNVSQCFPIYINTSLSKNGEKIFSLCGMWEITIEVDSDKSRFPNYRDVITVSKLTGDKGFIMYATKIKNLAGPLNFCLEKVFAYNKSKSFSHITNADILVRILVRLLSEYHKTEKILKLDEHRTKIVEMPHTIYVVYTTKHSGGVHLAVKKRIKALEKIPSLKTLVKRSDWGYYFIPVLKEKNREIILSALRENLEKYKNHKVEKFDKNQVKTEYLFDL